ncbi:MAG: hypothetical protein ACREAB_15490 [Blastocatellia bacterium]
MGATVRAVWPGITEEQLESQPGFYNDCKAWGDWMAERFLEPKVIEAIEALEVEPILTHITAGMAESEVSWVKPTELRDAAVRLREAVEASHHGAKIILKTYALNANNVDPVEQEFTQDLNDIVALAKWAEEEGATVMTLEVNW